MATKMILGDMYTRNARLAPNGTAFEYDGHRTTHGEFAARINRLANALSRGPSSMASNHYSTFLAYPVITHTHYM